jgi:hypothetical protein
LQLFISSLSRETPSKSPSTSEKEHSTTTKHKTQILSSQRQHFNVTTPAPLTALMCLLQCYRTSS